MNAEPISLDPERSALVDKAADWLVSQPHPPSPLILALMSEFPLTASEACAVTRRAYEMRICRSAFA